MRLPGPFLPPRIVKGQPGVGDFAERRGIQGSAFRREKSSPALRWLGRRTLWQFSTQS